MRHVFALWKNTTQDPDDPAWMLSVGWFDELQLEVLTDETLRCWPFSVFADPYSEAETYALNMARDEGRSLLRCEADGSIVWLYAPRRIVICDGDDGLAVYRLCRDRLELEVLNGFNDVLSGGRCAVHDGMLDEEIVAEVRRAWGGFSDGGAAGDGGVTIHVETEETY